MGESASSSTGGLADLASFSFERLKQQILDTHLTAGLRPLREIYYTYLHELRKEPENVYEMLLGYSYIILSRK